VSHEEGNNLLKGYVFFAIYWYIWFRSDTDLERKRETIIASIIGSILSIIVARAIAFSVPLRFRPIYDKTLMHPVYSVAFTPNIENWNAFPSDTAA